MTGKKQNPFLLRNFKGVNPEYIDRLEALGIKQAGRMLSIGQTPQMRTLVATVVEIPEAAVLELVRLSDLARLPGVKGIRARLYYEAGVDSVDKLAAFEPQELLSLTAQYVERTGFDGAPPLPKEVSSTIENARRLPKLVEW